jgi:hypothetical protein
MGKSERPEHTAPPDIFYNEDEARKYTTNTRMIAIQEKLTQVRLAVGSTSSSATGDRAAAAAATAAARPAVGQWPVSFTMDCNFLHMHA